MGPLGNCVIALRCCGRSRESGRSSLITVVFIRLKKKKKLAPIMYQTLCCTVGGAGTEESQTPLLCSSSSQPAIRKATSRPG